MLVESGVDDVDDWVAWPDVEGGGFFDGGHSRCEAFASSCVGVTCEFFHAEEEGLGDDCRFFEIGAASDFDREIACSEFGGLIGVAVIEGAAPHDHWFPGFQAHQLGDVFGCWRGAGVRDLVAKVGGQELLVFAGAFVAVVGDALQAPPFADERSAPMNGLDEAFGA